VVLVQQDRSGLPVVTADNGEILGWLTHRDVLAAYNTRLLHAGQPSDSASPPPAVAHSLTRLRIGIRRNGAPFTAPMTPGSKGDRLTLLVPVEHVAQITEYLQHRHRPPTDT
jgi:CBS domain-containing protein